MFFTRRSSRPHSGARFVRPRLECLEDRLTPTSLTPLDMTTNDTATPPPSQTQAVISLFLDGVAWELENLSEQFLSNPDGFPTSQTITNAAAAGIDYNAVLSLAQNVFQLTGHNAATARDDALANLPYAGSLALSALQAGVQAAQQAVRLS